MNRSCVIPISAFQLKNHAFDRPHYNRLCDACRKKYETVCNCIYFSGNTSFPETIDEDGLDAQRIKYYDDLVKKFLNEANN